MWAETMPARVRGMEIVESGRPGELTVRSKPHMVHGHRIAHGGFIFLLADSTFSFGLQLAQRALVAAAGLISPSSSPASWSIAGLDRRRISRACGGNLRYKRRGEAS